MRVLPVVFLASLLALSACEKKANSHTPAQNSKPISQIVNDGNDGIYKTNKPLTEFTDFTLVKTSGDMPEVVSMDEMVKDLAGYDVVFVGEAHGHIANHIVQSKVLAGLYKLHPDMAVSMEQFERSSQNVVDDYLADTIGEETLIHDGKAWEHYRQSYRPLVEFAKAHKLPVIAAEVPGNLVSCVGERGPDFLASLQGEPRKWIAQTLHTEDGDYKDKFYQFLSAAAGHSVSDPNESESDKARKKFNRFAAQVARDDTMAESIATHLQAHPGRKIMHINGSFHSAALLGTPERVKLRQPDVKMANGHPVWVENPDAPAFSTEDLQQGQYLILISPAPKRFRQMKNINAFIKRTKDKIDENRCKY